MGDETKELLDIQPVSHTSAYLEEDPILPRASIWRPPGKDEMEEVDTN